MRSMKMAALAIAITLTFSGLALARDNDHDRDKDKHDHWYKHDTTVIMIAIMTGKMTLENREHERERERREREHHWWERERHDNGYYRGGQVYNGYPQRLPGECVSRRRLWLSRAAATPAAVMAIPARCMDAEAAGGAGPMASAIRMAATWRARTSPEQTIQSQSATIGNRITATTVHSAARTTTRPSTSTDIPGYQANYRGGRGRRRQGILAISNWQLAIGQKKGRHEYGGLFLF